MNIDINHPEIEKYAPIIIPTLNRYEHLKRCVESLSRCNLADKTELIIGLDYPPSEKYVHGYKQICEYLPTISGFGKVTIIRRDRNYGVPGNASDLWETVLQRYDCYIFTEDDNEFAPNFLEYVNWGLREFKDDKTIFAICGCKDIDTTDINNNVYKLNTLFNAWGYGIWIDRYKHLKEVANLDFMRGVIENASMFDVFSKRVCSLASIASQLAMKTVHGDFSVSLLPANSKWCIFPSVNKVRNWGWDGTGTHGGSEESLQKYSSLPMDSDNHFTPVIVEDLYNPVVYQRFKEKYKKSLKSYFRAVVIFMSYKLTGYIPVSNKRSKWLKVKLQKVQ
jgi:glycosyltransferase involved in cell wall biosynthesis